MAEKNRDNNYTSFAYKKQGEIQGTKANCDKLIKIERKGEFFCMTTQNSPGIPP